MFTLTANEPLTGNKLELTEREMDLIIYALRERVEERAKIQENVYQEYSLLYVKLADWEG